MEIKKLQNLVLTGEPENIELAFAIAESNGILVYHLLEPLSNLIHCLRHHRFIKKEKPKEVLLEMLHLSYVRLTEIERIPDHFNFLMNLTYLQICNSKVSKIPAFFQEFYQLEIIHLDNNQFEIFPDVLLEMPNLKIVNLEGNSINLLPKNLVKLTNLMTIHLTGNPVYMIRIKQLMKLMPQCEFVKLY